MILIIGILLRRLTPCHSYDSSFSSPSAYRNFCCCSLRTMTKDYGAIALGKDTAPTPSVSSSEEASSESHFLTKECDESSSVASWSSSFFKNNKAAVLVTVVVIMGCAAMVQLTGSKKQSTIPSSSSLPLLGRALPPGTTWPPLPTYDDPLVQKGYLFSARSPVYETLSVMSWRFFYPPQPNRSEPLREFRTICMPKCRNDPKCTGASFYRGTCKFLLGDDLTPLAATGHQHESGYPMTYVKSSVGGFCRSPPRLNTNIIYHGDDCLFGLTCSFPSSTCAKEAGPPGPPATGKIVYQGHLFGQGYVMDTKLKIRKSLDDVENICLPKCRDDPLCTGFGFRIDTRYDGRTNGNCWFMTGEIKYVDGPPRPSGGGVYVKSSVGGHCADGPANRRKLATGRYNGDGCLYGLICDDPFSICITA
jgi:hypothetical protein